MRPIIRPIFILCLSLLSCFCWAEKGSKKSLEQFVEGLETQQGFYTFYYRQRDGKLFLQIKESQIGQPFLFQSSLPYGVGSNDIGLDRGQLGNTRLVQFDRFGKRVLLRQLNTDYRAISDNPNEVKAVEQAFASSVIAGLDIVAESKVVADSSSENESKPAILVDYTPFLLSDIHSIGRTLERGKQGKYKVDSGRSGVYLARSKAFVDNTELESLVTFGGSKPGKYVKQVTPSTDSISVHLHHSLIRLPDDDYQPRIFHPQSGYWAVAFKDYATAIDEPLVKRFIPRHRLKKKYPEEKVSEPVKPIIYYLDPGVPEPVRSALKEGALWWDQAFAEIGYKNAFQVKDLPENADPMDVHYNTIQWVHRATRGWSYGSSVQDPRTGEIIKGHVTLGSLRVRQDLLIALGLTSPFDGQQPIDLQKEMALARIRQLSAHEVGHTLGIAHNFAASENGRASVMDYPHPLLSLINGKVSLAQAYDTDIGEWDKQAIAYGYQEFLSPEAEQQGLLQIVKNTQSKGLNYLSDPDARGLKAAALHGHLWDNGKDPVEELQRLMQVRAHALDNFGFNSIADGTPLSQLEENLVPIYLLHRFQLEAVARQIGGLQYHYEVKAFGKKPKGNQPNSVQAQKAALAQLLTALEPKQLQLNPTLLRLINPQAYGYQRTREAFEGQAGPAFDALSAAESLAHYIVTLLLEPTRLNRLSQQGQAGFGVDTLLSALLDQTVIAKGNTTPISRRVEYIVVNGLIDLVESKVLGVESKERAFLKLHEIKERVKPNRLLRTRLAHYLETGEWKGQVEIAPLPPGSPI